MPRTSSSVTTRFGVTLLAGFALVTGCGNKNADDKKEPAAGAGSQAAAAPAASGGAATPGVTATEIKIGQSTALSGPASAFSVISKGEAA
jgi:hypothetical protein